MLFVRRVPAPPLDQSVDCLWYCENEPGPFALQRVLPSGAAQVIVNLKEDQTRMYRASGDVLAMTAAPGAVLSGAATRFCLIDTAEQECVAGVAFRPGGTPVFFPNPAHEMCDADVPLELFWGRHATSELRDRLLEARGAEARLDVLESALLLAWTTRGLHPAVRFALHTFEMSPETARIGLVAERVGLSAKRFIGHFKTSVGMAPKQYCRLLRFQRALGAAEKGCRVDWTR